MQLIFHENVKLDANKGFDYNSYMYLIQLLFDGQIYSYKNMYLIQLQSDRQDG